MARKRSAKSASKSKCDAIHDMSCVGVRVSDIAAYYGMPRSTVSNIIRRKSKSSTKVIRKPGPKRNLSDRSMRLFQRYVIQNCFKSLHTILALFYESTGVNLGLCNGKRYIRSLKIYCFVAVQKPYLSTKTSRLVYCGHVRTRTGSTKSGKT